MSAKIGPYTMTGMTGEIPAWRNEATVRARPGTDGYTATLQGKRSDPFQLLTTQTAASMKIARQRRKDYEALCGTFVPILTAEGDSLAAVLVLNVTVRLAELLYSTDGNSALVSATWTLQRMQ